MGKVVIIGGRDYADRDVISKALDKHITNTFATTVHMHGSIGVEKVVEDYCIHHNIGISMHRLDNEEMDFSKVQESNKLLLQHADHVILFWDGISEGTGDMHERVVKGRYSHSVIYY